MDDRSELVALLEAALFGDGRRLTGDEIAAEARIDRELIRRLRRAMGLPDVPDGEAAYTEQDLEAAKRAGELMREWDLDPSDLLYLSRTLGLAAARMADSIVSFWVDRMARDPRSVPTRGDLVPNLDRQVLYLLHRHLLDAASRFFSFSEPGEAGTAMAVGFADLVGFTALSRELPDSEVAAMIERFEATATDLVVSRDGRVVKMIGDEVMFSAHPEAAGDIALALAECFKSPELPPVRVGLAYGDVVAKGHCARAP
jgi:adenylate cyclase